MAKGQQRSNREPKKPKKTKTKSGASKSTSSKVGVGAKVRGAKKK